ncbi:SDR family oxidoreductase [Candidatus Woesearchaeota archaeon]|nr:SDR family oxidoreductase [Candidatus Woesearchaeota archaeon]
MQTKTVLVTGASSGIGAAFAEIFAKNKYNLILVARREKELNIIKKKCEQQSNAQVKIIIKDLTHSKAPEEIYNEIKKENLLVDILINNAGFGEYGSFYKTSWEKEAEMIQVNITALTALAKLFGQDMIQRKSGTIMNVSSVAAFLPGPLMSVYYATKAYVLSLSEALANDLEGTGVKVIALCPGMTKTGFQDAAGFAEKAENEKQMSSAEEVAAYGFKVIQKGKPVIAIPGIKNKIIARLGWLLPRTVLAKIIRSVQSGREKRE